jgi:hypothetical protein
MSNELNAEKKTMAVSMLAEGWNAGYFPHFNVTRRKAESHVADALPPPYPPDKCFQQKV